MVRKRPFLGAAACSCRLTKDFVCRPTTLGWSSGDRGKRSLGVSPRPTFEGRETSGTAVSVAELGFRLRGGGAGSAGDDLHPGTARATRRRSSCAPCVVVACGRHRRACVDQVLGAVCPHCASRRQTAHHQSEAECVRVAYPHHPLFGETLRVHRRSRRGGLDGLIVDLPDGLRCVVPSWMVDPDICAGLRDAAQPLIAAGALRDLRDLVDAGLSALSLDATTSAGSPGERHAEGSQCSAAPSPQPGGRKASSAEASAHGSSSTPRRRTPSRGEDSTAQGGS
jgi:hypothetical protein